jgi:hypothetical protein
MATEPVMNTVARPRMMPCRPLSTSVAKSMLRPTTKPRNGMSRTSPTFRNSRAVFERLPR